MKSDSYEVFSRSRLFLRLKGAGDQFAAAAGLPPDMDFLSQVGGERSALAVYDIGKMEFLYVTYLPSARSMQTKLWQARAGRIWKAYLRVAVTLASVLGWLMLTLQYFIVLPVFALAARWQARREAGGWRKARAARTLESQY